MARFVLLPARLQVSILVTFVMMLNAITAKLTIHALRMNVEIRLMLQIRAMGLVNVMKAMGEKMTMLNWNAFLATLTVQNV
jgi:hypothetical protein